MTVNEHIQIVASPETWNPQFCTMARVSLAEELQDTKDSVSKIDKRMFQLLCLAVAQLCTISGALAYFILSHFSIFSSVHAAIR